MKTRLKYRYSTPGVIFLGRIIEWFSGDDYAVCVTKNISEIWLEGRR